MVASRTRKQDLLIRIRRLRNWEAGNILLLPFLFLWIWLRNDSIAWLVRLPALALLLAMLVQGSAYWHLKLESMRDHALLPRWFNPLFRSLQIASLLSFALVVATDITVWTRRIGNWGDWAWGIGLLLFAALEYVNYYHWQLMHDSRADWAYLRRYRRLRRSSLASDLSRTIRRAGTGASAI